ncbi:MAG TPA: sulfatase [Planctomycetota bacterium]|nr:sulfatase [Planctomycetota bacterium]
MRSLLAVLLAGSALSCSGESRPARRVVLVSVDTLRADHMSLHGYGRDTTPELARLAAEDGVVFERCYAQSSWTLPSHMSMLTGLYPITHGVNSDDKRLARNVVTLAERLREAGFATAAFTDGGYVASGWGLEDGFQEYHDDRLGAVEGDSGLARILPHAERWLREHRAQDTFLFLHTYEVHAPYAEAEPWISHFETESPPPAEDVERLEYLRGLGDSEEYELDRFEGLQHLQATYDGLILRADQRLGRLFALLRELGIYDETLIVVTSDHGESFLDSGVYAGHGLLLTEAETRVPLVVKFPGNRFAGARSDALVESVDIAPTVLHALRVAPGAWAGPGHDLALLLEGKLEPRPHAFSFGAGLQSFAVRSPRWTLLEPVSEETAERILLERLEPDDPERVRVRLLHERRLEPTGTSCEPNELAQHPDVEARLVEAYAAWEFAQYVRIHERGQAAEGREALDERELERLRALGYL